MHDELKRTEQVALAAVSMVLVATAGAWGKVIYVDGVAPVDDRFSRGIAGVQVERTPAEETYPRDHRAEYPTNALDRARESYLGDPAYEVAVAGDINGDGRVDCVDWAILASHWLEHSGPVVSVMTFNIRCGPCDEGTINAWENRRDMVFDVIRTHDPDIVGLQEAYRYQLDEIHEALPNQYGEVGVGREDGGTKGEYVALLYRLDRFGVDESGTFWISDMPEVPGTSYPGDISSHCCTWARIIEKESGKAFYLYNAHLDAGPDSSSRDKGVILLANRADSRNYPDPVMMTGDFNAAEYSHAILYMKGQYIFNFRSPQENPLPMVDTFRVLHPDATDVGGWHAFTGDRTGNKIDYVLATPDIGVLDAEILHDNVDGRYPSDHFPVTALVRLSAPG